MKKVTRRDGHFIKKEAGTAYQANILMPIHLYLQMASGKMMSSFATGCMFQKIKTNNTCLWIKC